MGYWIGTEGRRDVGTERSLWYGTLHLIVPYFFTDDNAA